MMCEIKEHRFARVSVASRYNLGSCCRTPLFRRKVISTHTATGDKRWWPESKACMAGNLRRV